MTSQTDNQVKPDTRTEREAPVRLHGVVRSTKRLTNKQLMNLAIIVKDGLAHGCGAHNKNKIYQALKYVRDHGAPNAPHERRHD